MADRNSLTQARLRELLDYDPLTGLFTRLVDAGPRPNQKAGSIAGTVATNGYVRICVDGIRLAAHVLAWFWIHGTWPEHDIDHRDTVRHHNWLANLRPATRSQNLQNQTGPRSNNRSGFLGVYPHSNGKSWVAQITREQRAIYLGIYSTPEEASTAYQTAKAVHHPFVAT